MRAKLLLLILVMGTLIFQAQSFSTIEITKTYESKQTEMNWAKILGLTRLGCPGCKELEGASQAKLIMIQDDVNYKLTPILYYNNKTQSPTRVGLGNHVLIIHVYSSDKTVEDTVKVYTNNDPTVDTVGKTSFDFKKYYAPDQYGKPTKNKDTPIQFKVLYCPFSCSGDSACGFQECLNYSTIKITGGANTIDDIPDASTLTFPKPAKDKRKCSRLLPTVANSGFTPPPASKPLTPPFCWPLLLIFAFLGSALYMTGRNPFMGFNFSAPRLGRHVRYQARGRGISVDTMAAASSIMAGVNEAKSSKGEKKGEGTQTTKEGVKLGTSGLPFSGTVKMIKRLAGGKGKEGTAKKAFRKSRAAFSAGKKQIGKGNLGGMQVSGLKMLGKAALSGVLQSRIGVFVQSSEAGRNLMSEMGDIHTVENSEFSDAINKEEHLLGVQDANEALREKFDGLMDKGNPARAKIMQSVRSRGSRGKIRLKVRGKEVVIEVTDAQIVPAEKGQKPKLVGNFKIVQKDASGNPVTETTMTLSVDSKTQKQSVVAITTVNHKTGTTTTFTAAKGSNGKHGSIIIKNTETKKIIHKSDNIVIVGGKATIVGFDGKALPANDNKVAALNSALEQNGASGMFSQSKSFAASTGIAIGGKGGNVKTFNAFVKNLNNNVHKTMVTAHGEGQPPVLVEITVKNQFKLKGGREAGAQDISYKMIGQGVGGQDVVFNYQDGKMTNLQSVDSTGTVTATYNAALVGGDLQLDRVATPGIPGETNAAPELVANLNSIASTSGVSMGDMLGVGGVSHAKGTEFVRQNIQDTVTLVGNQNQAVGNLITYTNNKYGAQAVAERQIFAQSKESFDKNFTQKLDQHIIDLGETPGTPILLKTDKGFLARTQEAFKSQALLQQMKDSGIKPGTGGVSQQDHDKLKASAAFLNSDAFKAGFKDGARRAWIAKLTQTLAVKLDHTASLGPLSIETPASIYGAAPDHNKEAARLLAGLGIDACATQNKEGLLRGMERQMNSDWHFIAMDKGQRQEVLNTVREGKLFDATRGAAKEMLLYQHEAMAVAKRLVKADTLLNEERTRQATLFAESKTDPHVMMKHARAKDGQTQSIHDNVVTPVIDTYVRGGTATDAMRYFSDRQREYGAIAQAKSTPGTKAYAGILETMYKRRYNIKGPLTDAQINPAALSAKQSTLLDVQHAIATLGGAMQRGYGDPVASKTQQQKETALINTGRARGDRVVDYYERETTKLFAMGEHIAKMPKVSKMASRNVTKATQHYDQIGRGDTVYGRQEATAASESSDMALRQIAAMRHVASTNKPTPTRPTTGTPPKAERDAMQRRTDAIRTKMIADQQRQQRAAAAKTRPTTPPRAAQQKPTTPKATPRKPADVAKGPKPKPRGKRRRKPEEDSA